MKKTALLSVLAAAACAAGCNADPAADNGKGDQIPTPLPASSSTSTPVLYPKGPYGFTQGSVLGDASFQGFANAQANGAAITTIKLSHFYNPHAHDASYAPASAAEDDRLYPPGSPYGAGEKKPLALLIDVCSLWCGPCKEEAKSVLPALYAKYHPCGGEFMVQLIDGPNPGTPATQDNLSTWTSTFHVDYVATFDPLRQLQSLYNGNNFPDLAIVDTSTMTIAAFVAGLPSSTFWSTYESLLDASCLAGE